jgi:putative Mg2+ transporter-C (MgtC) family protein
MPPEIHWPAIGLRLVLTLCAGALLGSDRSRNGHLAGLRTVLLVTMAASVSMIQMNLLIPTNGRPPNSYAVMDLMRLPLGILTGVGFIGAGAIVRKGDMVQGVTTAATLWFGTVVGLCLGGGQLILGSVATIAGYLVLAGLRGLERRIEDYQPATLTVVTDQGTLAPSDLRRRLETARFRIKSISVSHSLTERQQRIICEVRWPALRSADVPQVIEDIERSPGVQHLIWRQVRTGPN